MKIKWDTLCGRPNVTTETDIVDQFGGAMCCWNCDLIYQARKSWDDAFAMIPYPFDNAGTYVKIPF